MTAIFSTSLSKDMLDIKINLSRQITNETLTLVVNDADTTSISLVDYVESDDIDKLTSVYLPLPITTLITDTPVRIEIRNDSKVLSQANIALSKANNDERPLLTIDKKPLGFKLRGWVVPKEGQIPMISLFIDGEFFEQKAPDLKRSDTSKDFPETADKMNGFMFTLPENCFDGQPHSFVVIEQNAGILARNCPLDMDAEQIRRALEERRNTLVKILSEARDA